jgi:hypothetical protein
MAGGKLLWGFLAGNGTGWAMTVPALAAHGRWSGDPDASASPLPGQTHRQLPLRERRLRKRREELGRGVRRCSETPLVEPERRMMFNVDVVPLPT